MKQFKAHKERFAGFYINVIIDKQDSDGYGEAAEWELLDKDKVFISKLKTLTQARLMAKTLAKKNKDLSR